MLLTELLDQLPPADRRDLNERLSLLANESELAMQMVHGLFAETRLPESALRDIADSLVAAAPDASSLKGALTQACRRHILRGEEIARPWPARAGRAVSLDAFCLHLHSLGYTTTLGQARWWTHRLLRGALADARSWLGRKLLGRHLMWATFDAEDGTRDPFGLLGSTAAEVQSRLGLYPSARSSLLLLFTYELPAGTPPRFPTAADMGAGSVWNWYFRPAVPPERHGWTQPWDPALRGVPEAVHTPVTGATLDGPIRGLR